MNTKVLLAKNDSIFAQGVSNLFKDNLEIELVGIASNETDTFRYCTELNPDVILLSIKLVNSAGIRKLINDHPDKRIIALAWSSEKSCVTEAMAAGAHGFINTAKASFDELLNGIRITSEGRSYICQDATLALATAFLNVRPAAISSQYHLCQREEQVLGLVAQGYSSKEIAKELFISPSTVEVHRRNLMRKVGLHKVADLTRYAIRNQLIYA